MEQTTAIITDVMEDYYFPVIETHMHTPLSPGKDVSLGLEGWPFWLSDLIRLVVLRDPPTNSG